MKIEKLTLEPSTAIREFEEQKQKEIDTLLEEMTGLNYKLTLLRKELDDSIKKTSEWKEQEFEKRYGQSSYSVRKSYINLLYTVHCAQNPIEGKYYYINGSKRITHTLSLRSPRDLMLGPKDLEKCTPTPLILLAFKLKDERLTVHEGFFMYKRSNIPKSFDVLDM